MAARPRCSGKIGRSATPTIRNPIEWSGTQLASAAHAAEAVGRSVDHMRQTAHSPAPAIRRISTADVWQSLREGIIDFEAYRSDVIFLSH